MLMNYQWRVKYYRHGDETGQLHTKDFDYENEMVEFIDGTGCEVFEEELVELPADPEMRVYVNVYYVTREYGGPEEGGWWYNRYSCVESVPVKNKRAELLVADMKEEYADRAYGNIYSVLGGREVEVYVERERCQSETRERPYYE